MFVKASQNCKLVTSKRSLNTHRTKSKDVRECQTNCKIVTSKGHIIRIALRVRCP